MHQNVTLSCFFKFAHELHQLGSWVLVFELEKLVRDQSWTAKLEERQSPRQQFSSHLEHNLIIFI